MNAKATENPDIQKPDELLKESIGLFADVLILGISEDGAISASSIRHPSEYLASLEKLVAMLKES